MPGPEVLITIGADGKPARDEVAQTEKAVASSNERLADSAKKAGAQTTAALVATEEAASGTAAGLRTAESDAESLRLELTALVKTAVTAAEKVAAAREAAGAGDFSGIPAADSALADAERSYEGLRDNLGLGEVPQLDEFLAQLKRGREELAALQTAAASSFTATGEAAAAAGEKIASSTGTATKAARADLGGTVKAVEDVVAAEETLVKTSNKAASGTEAVGKSGREATPGIHAAEKALRELNRELAEAEKETKAAAKGLDELGEADGGRGARRVAEELAEAHSALARFAAGLEKLGDAAEGEELRPLIEELGAAKKRLVELEESADPAALALRRMDEAVEGAGKGSTKGIIALRAAILATREEIEVTQRTGGPVDPRQLAHLDLMERKLLEAGKALGSYREHAKDAKQEVDLLGKSQTKAFSLEGPVGNVSGLLDIVEMLGSRWGNLAARVTAAAATFAAAYALGTQLREGLNSLFLELGLGEGAFDRAIQKYFGLEAAAEGLTEALGNNIDAQQQLSNQQEVLERQNIRFVPTVEGIRRAYEELEDQLRKSKLEQIAASQAFQGTRAAALGIDLEKLPAELKSFAEAGKALRLLKVDLADAETVFPGFTARLEEALAAVDDLGNAAAVIDPLNKVYGILQKIGEGGASAEQLKEMAAALWEARTNALLMGESGELLVPRIDAVAESAKRLAQTGTGVEGVKKEVSGLADAAKVLAPVLDRETVKALQVLEVQLTSSAAAAERHSGSLKATGAAAKEGAAGVAILADEEGKLALSNEEASRARLTQIDELVRVTDQAGRAAEQSAKLAEGQRETALATEGSAGAVRDLGDGFVEVVGLADGAGEEISDLARYARDMGQAADEAGPKVQRQLIEIKGKAEEAADAVGTRLAPEVRKAFGIDTPEAIGRSVEMLERYREEAGKAGSSTKEQAELIVAEAKKILEAIALLPAGQRQALAEQSAALRKYVEEYGAAAQSQKAYTGEVSKAEEEAAKRAEALYKERAEAIKKFKEGTVGEFRDLIAKLEEASKSKADPKSAESLESLRAELEALQGKGQLDLVEQSRLDQLPGLIRDAEVAAQAAGKSLGALNKIIAGAPKQASATREEVDRLAKSVIGNTALMAQFSKAQREVIQREFEDLQYAAEQGLAQTYRVQNALQTVRNQAQLAGIDTTAIDKNLNQAAGGGYNVAAAMKEVDDSTKAAAGAAEDWGGKAAAAGDAQTAAGGKATESMKAVDQAGQKALETSKRVEESWSGVARQMSDLLATCRELELCLDRIGRKAA